MAFYEVSRREIWGELPKATKPFYPLLVAFSEGKVRGEAEKVGGRAKVI